MELIQDGEMAQWTRACPALPGDLSLVANAHLGQAAHNACNPSSRGSHPMPSDLHSTHTHVAYTHRHINNNKELNSKDQ